MDGFTALLLGLLALQFSVRGRRAEALSRGTGDPPKRIVASTAERQRVLDAVAALGWPPQELDRVITRESGWAPAARNADTNAVGLIQFMPSTLANLGFSPDLTKPERASLFQRLPTDEQLPWIVKLFSKLPRWRQPGDTYIALAAPAFIGAPDATVIYDVGTAAWRLNPSLREPDGGPITARSIRARVI